MNTVICNICCSSIINTEDVDKYEPSETYIENSNKFVTLTCGHSICNLCHFKIVSNHNSIYIKCPVCREQNELNNCKPNYTLNESIFKLRMLYNEYSNLIHDVDKYIVDVNKNKYYTKNIKKLNLNICKEINQDKKDDKIEEGTKEEDKEEDKVKNKLNIKTHIKLNTKCFECPF